MNRIFEPFKLKNLLLKNRVVMPPMCMYMAEDGFANDWHFTHYATRAVGGVGMIIMEATGVLPEGRISTSDLGLWKNEQIEPLRHIVDFVHTQECAIGIQIGHAGRKSNVFEEDASAPSAVAFSEDFPVPHEMEQLEIDKVVNAFRASAARALEAGFDALELHGAHGYLISSFLSPLSNHRQDSYGGSLVKRFRFLKEILDAVKLEWPSDKTLILRLSADEYAPGGSNLEEKVKIASMAKAMGVDLVHVSSGGIVSVPMDVYPGYQLTHSEAIKKGAGIPTIAGGLVTREEQVQEILCNHRGDLVFVGRELLRNPYFVLNLGASKKAEAPWPESYLRARS